VLDGDKFVMQEGTYITDYITNNALEFLDIAEQKEQPFYLSVNYTAPHAPWDKKHHPDKFYSMYDDCEFKATPNEPTHEWAGGPQDRKQEMEYRENSLRGYYAAMSAMDAGIGKILKTLKDKNMLDNTLVVFTSDNGMSMGHHGIFGKGNGTFPLNMYDTAVKVPMIISYPKCLGKGIVNESLLSHYDIFPTIVDALGLDYVTEELPGKSFLLQLLNKEQSDDDAIVVYDEYGATRMIRTIEYKYIHRFPYGPHEFYDLTCDPDENVNEVENEKYQHIIVGMRKNLNDWFYKYVDPRIDGSREAVKGKGQIDLVGVYSQGKNSFKDK
jgi:arylsulfatase A-like enzyme